MVTVSIGNSQKSECGVVSMRNLFKVAFAKKFLKTGYSMYRSCLDPSRPFLLPCCHKLLFQNILKRCSCHLSALWNEYIRIMPLLSCKMGDIFHKMSSVVVSQCTDYLGCHLENSIKFMQSSGINNILMFIVLMEHIRMKLSAFSDICEGWYIQILWKYRFLSLIES